MEQFGGREVSSAFLALVSIRPFIVAMRAFACDIAIGEALFGLLIVVLFGFFFQQFSIFIELAEEVAGQLMVCLRGGSAIDIERDTEVFEALFNHRMVAIHNILRCNALFAGSDGDGNAMFVGAADKDHVLVFQPQITHIDICGHVYAGQMSDVHTAIGIGKSCSNGGALIVFLFHRSFF